MIDLHVHSTASDGSCSPAEVVRLAHAQGIEAMALTDHDTVAGLDEAQKEADRLGIEFIRGCEVSAKSDLGEVHILGLWIPGDCPKLEAYLAEMRKRREFRNNIIVDKLRELGLDITIDEVMAVAKGTPGRPHIAKVMQNKGYVRDHADAFTRYLGRGGAAYVPKPVPPAQEAVKVLHEHGATIAMAHPLLRSWPLDWLDSFVKSLADNGLSALEAWHSSQSEQDSENIIRIAGKYNLLLTGGSDFHGQAKPDIRLGLGRGNLNVKLEVLQRLKNWRKERNLPC